MSVDSVDPIPSHPISWHPAIPFMGDISYSVVFGCKSQCLSLSCVKSFINHRASFGQYKRTASVRLQMMMIDVKAS